MERWVQNEKNEKDKDEEDSQIVCEAADTNFIEKWGEDRRK